VVRLLFVSLFLNLESNFRLRAVALDHRIDCAKNFYMFEKKSPVDCIPEKGILIAINKNARRRRSLEYPD